MRKKMVRGKRKIEALVVAVWKSFPVTWKDFIYMVREEYTKLL